MLIHYCLIVWVVDRFVMEGVRGVVGCPRVLGWAPVPWPAGYREVVGTGGARVTRGTGLAGGARRWPGRRTIPGRVGS